MARGFLSGIVWGTLVSGMGLVAASQYGPTVSFGPAQPENVPAEAPEGAGGAGMPGTAPDAPATSDAVPGRSAPPAAPAPDSASAPPVADTQSAAAPDAPDADAGGIAPPAVGEAPEVAAGAEEPVLPSPGALQPPQPSADLAPVAEAEEPAADASPDTTEAAPVPESEPEPEAAGEAAVEAEPDVAAGDAADAPPVVDPDVAVGLRLPVPEIEDMAPGVTTDRLPTIGAQPEAEAETTAEPALTAYSVPFEAPPGAPLMAVILRDPGADRPDPGALSGFPVPVTVAIDPRAEDAGPAMAAYRAAGVEVLVLTPLAEGAAPAEVEVAFESFLTAVPEAVAVLDLPEAVLQESRPRAAQVAEILAATGHGLITYERGLNSGLQVADGAGVKAITVFRAFDDGGRDEAAMKRFLDQGAFRAGQQNGVVMVGELRPETLSVLAEWALGTRAQTVALAPVSAVLSNQ